MMKFFRKTSPPVMAVGGLGLMAFGGLATFAGVPPIPGLGPLETMAAGYGLFVASFAVPEKSSEQATLALEDKSKDRRNQLKPSRAENGDQVKERDISNAASGTEIAAPLPTGPRLSVAAPFGTSKNELAAFGIISFCGTVIAVASIIHGSMFPAYLILGILSFVGINRFFAT